MRQSRSTQKGPETIRTMEDLAAFTGLSRPTISKFFDDPASVRASTRARIEAAIRESGFRPNLFAVNLQRRRSKIIGVIIPDGTDPFYMELTRRIQQIADDAGYFAVVLGSGGREDREADAIDRLQSMNVMGMIVAPIGREGTRARLEDLAARIPIVYVDAPPDDNAPFVGTDNDYSFGLMVDYLCRSGTPPCFLGMPLVNRNAGARAAAYRKAMALAGQEAVELSVPTRPRWDFERFGHEQMTEHLRRGLPSSTVLCANDRVALGAQLAAWEADLSIGIGKDIRIAGHDDHPLSRYACPPLTTVAQQYALIAKSAMEQVLAPEPVGGAPDSPHRVLFKAELVLRSSA